MLARDLGHHRGDEAQVAVAADRRHADLRCFRGLDGRRRGLRVALWGRRRNAFNALAGLANPGDDGAGLHGLAFRDEDF